MLAGAVRLAGRRAAHARVVASSHGTQELGAGAAPGAPRLGRATCDVQVRWAAAGVALAWKMCLDSSGCPVHQPIRLIVVSVCDRSGDACNM